MKKFKTEGEEYLFDSCPPDEYFKGQQFESEVIGRTDVFKYFNGEQSSEFYKGMIAAFRSAVSILRSSKDLEITNHYLIEANLVASFLGNQKQAN